MAMWLRCAYVVLWVQNLGNVCAGYSMPVETQRQKKKDSWEQSLSLNGKESIFFYSQKDSDYNSNEK